MNLNTSDELVTNNILSASRRQLPWLDNGCCVFSGKVAIIGGAPSLKDKLDELRAFDGMILTTNGAHDYLAEHGIKSDLFFQLDARKCNRFAQKKQDGCVYILASQCHPDSFDTIKPNLVCHVDMKDFPHKKVGNIAKLRDILQFTYVSGKGSVGMTAIALAYTLGFKEFHLYGLDSSFGDEHHAYSQSQNDNDQIIEHTVNGQVFKTTPELCNQMYNFQHMLPLLRDCKFEIRSEGLIKAVYHAKDHLTLEQREAEKYKAMWGNNDYRTYSPGYHAAPMAIELMKPSEGAKIIDFGIGSGKGAAALKEHGFDVHGVDIAPNSLDEGKHFPVCIAPLWDIPDEIHGEYGYCTDVMEHIPTEKVDDVLRNIAKTIDKCVFFQIDLAEDSFGQTIGDILHLTVKPAEWWSEKLSNIFSIKHFSVTGRTLVALCEVKHEFTARG